MSDFVQQQNSICDFNSSDSWVILSPIEQSIKRKIEAVGTPLKDWDINIYRGVLTGYNDAFIIDTAKRDEILANCKTDDERKRTDELIRPYSFHKQPNKIATNNRTKSPQTTEQNHHKQPKISINICIIQ